MSDPRYMHIVMRIMVNEHPCATSALSCPGSVEHIATHVQNTKSKLIKDWSKFQCRSGCLLFKVNMPLTTTRWVIPILLLWSCATIDADKPMTTSDPTKVTPAKQEPRKPPEVFLSYEGMWGERWQNRQIRQSEPATILSHPLIYWGRSPCHVGSLVCTSRSSFSSDSWQWAKTESTSAEIHYVRCFMDITCSLNNLIKPESSRIWKFDICMRTWEFFFCLIMMIRIIR